MQFEGGPGEKSEEGDAVVPDNSFHEVGPADGWLGRSCWVDVLNLDSFSLLFCSRLFGMNEPGGCIIALITRHRER